MIHPERRGQAPRARLIEEMLAHFSLNIVRGFEWI